MAADFSSVQAETQPTSDASMASLVAGIIGDVQVLVTQQLKLTRQELVANLQLRQSAALIMSIGAGLGFIAGLLLSVGLVHFLHQSTGPLGTDPNRLSLGACYAIVSTILFAGSLGLLCWGRLKLRAIPAWQNVAEHILRSTNHE